MLITCNVPASFHMDGTGLEKECLGLRFRELGINRVNSDKEPIIGRLHEAVVTKKRMPHFG